MDRKNYLFFITFFFFFLSTPGALTAEELQPLIEKFIKLHEVNELSVQIFNFNHKNCYNYSIDKKYNDKPIPVASASKWISSSIILRLVDRKILSLDDTTGKWLGWDGEKGKITIRELLSFTSGLVSEHFCVLQPFNTLKDCTEKIYQKSPANPPKNTFDYGSTHMTVAARMAEIATKLPWEKLVYNEFVLPLGLKKETIYYTWPKKYAGNNPLIGAGLVISTNDYLKFLKMIADDGKFNGKTYLSTDILKTQRSRVFNAMTVIKNSPQRNPNTPYEYALGLWRECTPNQCDDRLRISSAGSFGFYPWVDFDKKYYAIIATNMEQGFSRILISYFAPFRFVFENIAKECK